MNKPLTRRQHEIRDLTVRGYTIPQIARQLGISPRTVEDHRHDIFRAYGVHNLASLLFEIVKQDNVACPLCGRGEATQ